MLLYKKLLLMTFGTTLVEICATPLCVLTSMHSSTGRPTTVLCIPFQLLSGQGNLTAACVCIAPSRNVPN